MTSKLRSEEFHKTVPVIRELDLNPCCEHGPTILFDRNGSRFFSCSAYRDRHLCSFYCTEEEWETDKQHQQDIDTPPAKKMRTPSKDDQEVGISSKLSTPTLPPATQIDRGEAQYHFTEETVNFFAKLLEEVGISSVICIGTPSLHQHFKNTSSLNIDSFLLDIDQRLIDQFPPTDCARYNMCNHHFFQNKDPTRIRNVKKTYTKFLKRAESLAIITDPPFGAKVELIWNGALKNVKKDFYQYHPDTAKCEVLWVFPYFMEGHILSKCPESNLKMSDYKVLYKNHAKFKEKSQGTGNGKLSPVRIFTSISLSLIKLPSNLYRFCDICDKWVERRNLHCGICETCPTKDGGNSYNHCNKCQKCVKPTWKHCSSPCGICHLSTSPCPDSSNTITYSNRNPRHSIKAKAKKSGSRFKTTNKSRHNKTVI